ncbi:MAG TPA: energy transducer TonB [Candidatus Binatus sp.]|nr:energy transducer TonB [Candidatus Binatus sp.]
MTLSPFLRPITLAFLILVTPFVIPAQDSSPANASPAADAASPDGLKLLIRDIFTAMKSKDEKVSSYFSSMALPEHTTWFTKTFGPTEGARMDAKYADLLPGMPEDLKRIFEYARKDDRTNPEVSVVEKSGPASGLGRAVVDAMLTPIPLYVASGSNPKQQFGVAIGDFFYVDGAFRFMPTQVLQALSTAPPLRVRIGGNTQRTKLVRKVDPIYPAIKTQGSVLLHVVLAVDGSVSEITVVNGDPVLAKAAVDAVRQWRYQPTMLDSKTVEVDTTVLVEFKR